MSKYKQEIYHTVIYNLIYKDNDFSNYYHTKNNFNIDVIEELDCFSILNIIMDYCLNELVNNNNIFNAGEVIRYLEIEFENTDYLEWFMEVFRITKSSEKNLMSIWPKSLSPNYEKTIMFPNEELIYKIVPEDDPYWEYIKLESQKVLKLDSKT